MWKLWQTFWVNVDVDINDVTAAVAPIINEVNAVEAADINEVKTAESAEEKLPGNPTIKSKRRD